MPVHYWHLIYCMNLQDDSKLPSSNDERLIKSIDRKEDGIYSEKN